MKKFLTVLLVIAVMFTFSFSSAFATVDQGTVAKDKAQFATAYDFVGAFKNVDTKADATKGTLGATAEERDNWLEYVDDNLAYGHIPGFNSAQDYTAYYGAKAPVEILSTSYAGKALAQFDALVDAAKIVAKAVREPNTTNTNALKKLVIGETVYGVAASGLPTVLNEYRDVQTVGENFEEPVNTFMSNAEAKELTAVWTEAKAKVEKATTAYEMVKAVAAANEAEGDITAKYQAYEKQIVKYAKVTPNAKLTDGMYLVPNYGRFVFNGLNKNYSLALGELTPNEQHAVIAWLLDNGYTTKASFEEGTAKFVEALVPYKTWSKDYSTDLNALAKKIANVNQSLLIAKSTETKLADVAALYDERDAFVAKYAVTQELLGQISEVGIDIELTGIANVLRQEIAAAVVTNADAIKALNLVHNTMTADEITEAIKLANELYANFYALYDDDNNWYAYTVMNKIYPVKFDMAAAIDCYKDNKWGKLTGYPTSEDLTLATVLLYAKDTTALKLLAEVSPIVVTKFGKLVKAFEDFEELDGIIVKTTGIDLYDGKTSRGFSATAANLAGIEDARTAVDAFYATYGDLVYEFDDEYDAFLEEYVKDGIPYDEYIYETCFGSITNLLAGRLLAAEYNAVACGAVDPKPTAAEKAAAQAVLDNATVKVTTQALGNGKIRVQAKLDDDTWAFVKGEVALGKADAISGTANFAKAPKYTVEYKFYKKKAADKKYKGYSDKTANYTVFKNLKKGTKYNFRCAVTLKDANGNVVATRAFTGSTKGTRTAK